MSKPLPAVTADTRPFWDGCREGRLLYQLCPRCQAVQFPPAIFCRSCGAEPEWAISRGEGVVHSFTIVARAPLPAFHADTPYIIALVDFHEGFRLMLNLVDPGKRVRIGDPVVVTFEARAEGLSLPQARLKGA